MPVHAPKGLQKAGLSLWKDVAKTYELRPDELRVLESAAKTADIVARLEVELEGQPLTVKGSMGQLREHPLLSEQRQQRAQLARLLAQLKLPDEAAAPVNQQRAAAQTRWQQAHG